MTRRTIQMCCLFLFEQFLVPIKRDCHYFCGTSFGAERGSSGGRGPHRPALQHSPYRGSDTFLYTTLLSGCRAGVLPASPVRLVLPSLTVVASPGRAWQQSIECSALSASLSTQRDKSPHRRSNWQHHSQPFKTFNTIFSSSHSRELLK